MSGANAPARPAGPRPTDPKRFQSVDMYAENTEGDIEYQRMVKDIEEMQQRQGWLTGRGAFDKADLLYLHLHVMHVPVMSAFDEADLLYLRDTAEQQRHIEMEQRDTETAAFAAARARVEREEALETLLPLKSAGSGGALTKPPLTKSTKPLVAPRVKVKASNQPSHASSGSNTSSQPAAKKPRTEDAAGDQPAAAAAVADPAAAVGTLAAAGAGVPSSAAADAGGSSNPSPAGGAAATPSSAGVEDEDDAAAGLGGLLGGYGSASDSDAESDKQQQQQQHGTSAEQRVQLPSAADALANARVWDPDAEKEPEEPRRVGFGLLGAQDDTGLLDWGEGPVEDEQRAAAAGQDHDRRQHWV